MNEKSKLTVEIVLEMRRRKSIGVSYVSLSREFGVTRANARRAVLGINWGHI